jgi:alcohol dehydrogenase class IV
MGGGSTIDVGKWLAFKYKIKHTAMPTTAGTGSEATKYCVLTTDGQKKTYDLQEPDSYILNPSLVVTLPELYTLSSGLDALSQAMEAHWSTNATPESRNYSAIAIEMVVNNLKKSMEQPKNERYRMNMLMAANFSGRAINITKTNVCHAISYPLTDLYGIPHGIACAYSLPYFAEKMGFDLEMFFLQFQLPLYDIDREKVADIVMGSEKLKSYPQAISRQDVIDSLL